MAGVSSPKSPAGEPVAVSPMGRATQAIPLRLQDRPWAQSFPAPCLPEGRGVFACNQGLGSDVLLVASSFCQSGGQEGVAAPGPSLGVPP
jgi:hypothetical protein